MVLKNIAQKTNIKDKDYTMPLKTKAKIACKQLKAKAQPRQSI
jgi:hypothetical protein